MNHEQSNIVKSNELNFINYIVKDNDTLIDIVSRYGINREIIYKYNDKDNLNKLYSGQIVRIPNCVVKDINPTSYIVKKDDTINEIVEKYSTSWEKIYEKNKNIIGKDPNIIKPGQILNI